MKKYPSGRESVIANWIAGVFLKLPLALAEKILELFSRIDKPVIRYGAFGSLVLLSVLCVVGFWTAFDRLNLLFQSLEINQGLAGSCRILFFYVFYAAAGMPVFLLVARISRDAGACKPETKRFNHTPAKMRRFRLRSDYRKVYIGHSFTSGSPFYLTNDQRQMHCEVVGSTGTGKTESVLLPMLAHDIAHGKGAVILDGKGDLELLNRIQYILQSTKRQDDFFFFSLAHPEKSNTYNPLFRGNPTELKDKLINSIPWSEEFYRRMAEQAALTLFNAIQSRKKNKTTCFRDLHAYLTDIEALKKLSDETKDPALKEDIGKMVKSFKDNQKFLSGLMADLYLTSRSEFSDLLDTTSPEIDLAGIYQKNQICYFALDLQKYTDTSRRLGRMIIQDIRAVSSHIQAKIPEYRRHFFPIFIDDASSFLEVNFIDFLTTLKRPAKNPI